jgi:hypothetical protein
MKAAATETRYECVSIFLQNVGTNLWFYVV